MIKVHLSYAAVSDQPWPEIDEWIPREIGNLRLTLDEGGSGSVAAFWGVNLRFHCFLWRKWNFNVSLICHEQRTSDESEWLGWWCENEASLENKSKLYCRSDKKFQIKWKEVFFSLSQCNIILSPTSEAVFSSAALRVSGWQPKSVSADWWSGQRSTSTECGITWRPSLRRSDEDINKRSENWESSESASSL